MAQQDNEVQVSVDAVSLSMLGTFMLFDEINEQSAKATCEFILKSNMVFDATFPLILFVNSPGGSLSDGFAIIDTMTTSRIPIQTIAIGEVASMGAAIFVAGKKGARLMTKNSSMMTHQFSAMVYGKTHELMAVRKYHDVISSKFINHFKRHTKMSEKQIKDILLRESDTWLEPKECLKYGLCDKIVEEPWTDIRTARSPTISKTTKKK